MPEIVQFKNGNKIENLYNAGGQKLSQHIYTLFTPLAVPLATGTVTDWFNDHTVNYEGCMSGTDYINNIEYKTSETEGRYFNRMSDKIYTSEGYITTDTPYPVYHYFRKDHLGNNREVWNGNTNSTEQRTQYYPSGLPWAESTGQEVQNKKYNGKEFVEAHGLDEYDSMARWLYPAILRTTTLDPLAEKYYSISPYAWCGNNPIKMVDPDGKWPRWIKDIVSGWNRLNNREKYVITFNMAYVEANNTSKNEIIAENITASLFGGNGKGDLSDAFRHTLFQALNTQSNGENLTQQMSDAHEYSTPANEVTTDLYMDIHNNTVGIEIGKENPNKSLRELKNIILDKLKKGEMLVINAEGILIKSDGTNIKNASEIKRVGATMNIATEIANDPNNANSQKTPDYQNIQNDTYE